MTEKRSLSRTSLGSSGVFRAASMKWETASAMKAPEPQAGVQDGLVQRVGHHLPHHGPSEPSRSVVLAELAALTGRYDRLVEDGGDVGWGLAASRT